MPHSYDEWLALARELAADFATRAPRHDRDGTFPYENFEALRQVGFPALTVPTSHGGHGATLTTFLRVMETLAQGDSSTAFAFNMHALRIGAEAEQHSYPMPWFDEICRGAVEEGLLCNTIATEEGLGSPAGGGLPDTTLTPADGGYVLNGHKTFGTLSPILNYFIVLARLEDPARPVDAAPEVANIMVLRGDQGLHVDDNWDAMGVRATGSHDVRFTNLFLPPDRLLAVRRRGSPDPRGEASIAWFALGISACTLGTATAARNYAVDYARSRTPNSNKTIKDYPGVRSRIARIDMLLQRCRALLYDAAAARAVQSPEGMPAADRVAVAKIETLNACIEAVDLAMRVVGGVSLLRSRPLERFYRDVRIGLHNPPLEDRGLDQLARHALDGERVSAG